LKVSSNVKIALQCFEHFWGANAPPLVARLLTNIVTSFNTITGEMTEMF